MPVISSSYRTPSYLSNGDLQTIVPAVFRNVNHVYYVRERISTPDDDFLDIDWLPNDSKKIALIIHGLEASAHRTYMKGMAKALHANSWNVAAMNLRGCSGELNKQARSYHSGSTDDVETIIRYILNHYPCEELVIVGFSLGGNLTLKYLGEQGENIPSEIKKAVAISVPCNLKACAEYLDHHALSVYRKRFLKTLKQKALQHLPRVSFKLSRNDIRNVHSLVDYDHVFTAPLYGFSDAYDYYEKCSSKKFIGSITIPALILTAKNDPFLTSECLPVKECECHPNVFLETPDKGGHVGFSLGSPWGNYYSEIRTIEFLNG